MIRPAYVLPIRTSAAPSGVRLPTAWLVPDLLLPIANDKDRTRSSPCMHACIGVGVDASRRARAQPPIYVVCICFQWVSGGNSGPFYGTCLVFRINDVTPLYGPTRYGDLLC